jgi:hypothetical protein
MTARVADNTHLGPDTNAFPPDTFERVIRALNVAYYEWTPGSDPRLLGAGRHVWL